MKKLYTILILSVLFLAGCDQTPTEKEDDGVIKETVIKGTDGNFNTIIPQVESPIRGISNGTNQGSLDLDEMEEGLIKIAKKYLDVNLIRLCLLYRITKLPLSIKSCPKLRPHLQET